jgi:hypothetical protein
MIAKKTPPPAARTVRWCWTTHADVTAASSFTDGGNGGRDIPPNDFDGSVVSAGSGGGAVLAGGDTTGIDGIVLARAGVSAAVGVDDDAGKGGGVVVPTGDAIGRGGATAADGTSAGIGGGFVVTARGGVAIARGVAGSGSISGGSINHDGRTNSSESLSSESSSSESHSCEAGALPALERGNGGAEPARGGAGMDGEASRAGRMERAYRSTSSTRAAPIEDVDPPKARSAPASVAASGKRVAGFFSRHRSTTSPSPFEIAESKSRGDRGCSDITLSRTSEAEPPSNGSTPVKSS